MNQERAALRAALSTSVRFLGDELSAVAKLHDQKEALTARLQAEPGPNERAEIQALLAEIETALKLLGGERSAPVGADE